MANTYTSTAANSIGTSLVQPALDKYIEYQLRAAPLFRALADKKPVDQSFPGVTVTFQFWNELPDPATSGVPLELSETIDPDAIGVPSTQSVTVTLREYGATILYTRKVQLVTITDILSGMGDLVSWHMVDQLDKLVSPVLNGGTNVVRLNGGTIFSNLKANGPGTLNGVTATDVYSSAVSRFATAKMRTNKVVPRQGELYAAFIHPDVSHDL